MRRALRDHVEGQEEDIDSQLHDVRIDAAFRRTVKSQHNQVARVGLRRRHSGGGDGDEELTLIFKTYHIAWSLASENPLSL